jgi:peptidylprolyl isomerase
MELNLSMKTEFLMLLIAASTTAAIAQTPAKPAAPAAPPAHAAASSTAHATASSTGVTLPPGIPPVKGIVKTAFSERWEDIKIGTGADAVTNKMYKVNYTGWLASDGKKFDSSYDHPGQPLKDKDGKPVLGPDGKPKLGDPEPISFPQGFGRLIPGFDQGFEGMKVGGKRRIFIPWQLAYGDKGRPGPDAAHPVIPPKSDLIFDVELVDISDMPAQPNRPMQMRPGAATPGAGTVPKPVTPPPVSAPATAPVTTPPPAPATPPATTAPATTAPVQPQSK